jgi:hypothetical protein
MADFRTKLITLAGMATVFAGMAFGQATVSQTGAAAVPVLLRAEGTTENVAASTVTVNQSAALAATVNLTVYLSPSLTITSQTVSGKSETNASANGVNYAGTVSGSTVTFSGIAIPAGAGTMPITITGIRVNATQVVNNGVPTGISETFFVSGTNITTAVPTAVTVAYALNGLGAITQSGTNSGNNPNGFLATNTICNGAVVTTVNFQVSVTEGFATAFQSQADEQVVGGTTAAKNPTRLTLTFANVPSAVAVYVPLTVASPTTNSTAVITAVTSATGATGSALAQDANLKNPTEPVKLAAVTLASGTGTIYYEVTADSQNTIDTFPINVYLVNAAGSLQAPTSAITATVSFAPIGSSSAYPSFSSTSTTTTVSAGAFGACTTTLLFPYVTNASGFETGIAIANTSLDTLKSGATSVATQSGTCGLSFFGNATATSNPATFTSASIAAGTTWAGTLTSAAGANFTGYIIANCNFQFAHAFSYIVYNFGTTSGTAMGYLAEVIPGARGAAESLNN